MDYPSVVFRDMVQVVSFTQNVITSTHVLERKTYLDNIETQFINRMARDFVICKLFRF